jgi:hypothetical protein
MPTYSYAHCLANSYKVAWKIEDVLGTRASIPPSAGCRLALGAGRDQLASTSASSAR